MPYLVFYVDYVRDLSVEAHDAYEAPLADIVAQMESVLQEPENFIGLVDDNDVTLQFMVNDDLSILVDIPIPERDGSLAKDTTLDECLELVRNLGETIVVDDIDGLEFAPWS